MRSSAHGDTARFRRVVKKPYRAGGEVYNAIKDIQLFEIERTMLSNARYQCALCRFCHDHPHAFMSDTRAGKMVIWHLASISACLYSGVYRV